MDLLLKVLCQVRLPFQKALLHSTGFMLIWNWGDWRSDGMGKYKKRGMILVDLEELRCDVCDLALRVGL